MEYAYVKTANGDLIRSQIEALNLPGYQWMALSEAADGTKGVVVSVAAELSADVKASLDTVIANHNAAQLTPRQQAAKDAADAATAARTAAVTIAGSAVGLAIGSLTAAQVRALEACLLWKAGALNSDGTVKPLASWL